MNMGCLRLEHIEQKWTPLKVVHRALEKSENEDVNQLVITDHLGQVRCEFKDNGSGTAVVTSTQHYMPFGLDLEGAWTSQNQQTKNNYLKLGGERTRLFDLDYDLHAFRNYDPANPGWTAREPLAELFPEWGSFTANGQNPVSNIDPLGLNWYRSNETGDVHWQEGDGDIDGYKNLGANHTIYGENQMIVHQDFFCNFEL